MKVSILTIGDEILNGTTIDTNAVFMAENLISEGIDVSKMLTVSDTEDEIVNALDFLKTTAEVIFITGGLGPTKDDITVKTLAKYVGQDLVFNEENYNHVNMLLSQRRKKDIEVDKSRCMFPEKTIFLNNQKGTAPGMWLEKNGVILISMPGVPLEMKQIFIDEALPKIKASFKVEPLINKYVLTAGIWESLLAKEIEDIENDLPDNIKLAYLPKLGRVKIRITGRNTTEKEVEKHQNLILKRVSEYVFSTQEKDSLEKVIGEILIQKQKTVTVAESCSGGNIAHKITSVAGCSAYYNGSIITYSNEQKMKKLEVSKQTLKNHGAVSEQTVEQMAQGVLKLIPSDYSIAVSGIAGPTGGTEEKPVGMVWIAVADKEKVVSKKFQFWPYRAENIELASIAALNMLRKFIQAV